MAASPRPEVIAAAMRASEVAFAKEVSEALPELVFRREPGKSVARANGITVIIHGKVIRASNGEVAGWPIASIIRGEKEISLYEPPRLGGCTVSNVVDAYNLMKEMN